MNINDSLGWQHHNPLTQWKPMCCILIETYFVPYKWRIQHAFLNKFSNRTVDISLTFWLKSFFVVQTCKVCIWEYSGFIIWYFCTSMSSGLLWKLNHIFVLFCSGFVIWINMYDALWLCGGSHDPLCVLATSIVNTNYVDMQHILSYMLT